MFQRVKLTIICKNWLAIATILCYRIYLKKNKKWLKKLLTTNFES